jgi:hypothetical protein
MSDYRAKLIIGLADEQVGERLHNAVRHLSGAAAALTVSPTSLVLGTAGGSIGFYGAAATVQSAAATVNATTLVGILKNYGLLASTAVAG